MNNVFFYALNLCLLVNMFNYATFRKEYTEIIPYEDPVLAVNKEDLDIEEYQSVQSMAVSYDASYIFVMYIMPDDDKDGINDASAMAVFERNESGEYEIKNINHALDKGHASGATYYEEDGNAYVVVAPPVTDEENSLYRYRMDLNDGTVISTDVFSLSIKDKYVENIRSVSYDRDEEAFYVTDGKRLLKYDREFQNGEVIRSKSKKNNSPEGGTPGVMYINQDGTVSGDCFYSVTYFPNQIDKYKAMGLRDAKKHAEARDSVIVVYDKNTGDFKNFVILDSSEVANVTSKYYSDNTENYMVEIEDVEFTEDRMFLLYQKGGNFQILCTDKPFEN